MTDKDELLIKQAHTIKYSDYRIVHDMISLADTDECRSKLKAIRDLLYEIHSGIR